MHICVGNLTIIGSDNGLSPGWRQAIILTNAGILLIGPLGTNFNGILIEIQTFSFKEVRLKLSSAKWRPFCLGLNVLIPHLAMSDTLRYLTSGFQHLKCWFGLVLSTITPAHILIHEAETRWPPFCRRHFQTCFLVLKLFYFDSNFTEICSHGSS